MEQIGAQTYEYEVVLPGWLEAHPRGPIPSYGREKTLGPLQVGRRLTFVDVALGALTLPEVEWEIERIEDSPELEGRLILRRPSE
jgi:hypothetical protein